MSTSPPEKDDEPIAFEHSFAQIESIVKQLEQGTLGLDESLAAYHRAIRHLRFCQNKLADATRRVELLQDVAPDGSFTTQEFDDAQSSLEEKASNRSTRRSSTSKKSSPKSDDLF